MRLRMCSLTSLCAKLGQTPVRRCGWYLCSPQAGTYPVPFGKAAAGSGCRALTCAGAAGAGPCWDLPGWALVSAPSCAAPGGSRLGDAGMALSSLVSSSPWRCARNGADGDMQNREINKLEFEYDQPMIWRSFR